MTLSIGGLPLAYLCFVDDLFILVKASMNQIEVINYQSLVECLLHKLWVEA